MEVADGWLFEEDPVVVIDGLQCRGLDTLEGDLNLLVVANEDVDFSAEEFCPSAAAMRIQW